MTPSRPTKRSWPASLSNPVPGAQSWESTVVGRGRRMRVRPHGMHSIIGLQWVAMKDVQSVELESSVRDEIEGRGVYEQPEDSIREEVGVGKKAVGR